MSEAAPKPLPQEEIVAGDYWGHHYLDPVKDLHVIRVLVDEDGTKWALSYAYHWGYEAKDFLLYARAEPPAELKALLGAGSG